MRTTRFTTSDDSPFSPSTRIQKQALAFALGRAINGGLSSRRAAGVVNGFAAAFLLHHTCSSARTPLAVWARDVCADALAGYASGGGATARKNVVFGQMTTVLGHTLGWLTTRGAAYYEDEVYFYESAWWTPRGAIALGNAVVGAPGLHADGWVKEHELGHRWQALVLGVLYIPFHLVALAIARFVDGTTHGRSNVLENRLHPLPYNRRAPGAWIWRQWRSVRL